MRHLLNTFFVSTDGAYIHRKGEQLEVCLDHEVIGSVPSHILQSLVCFGRISVSPGAMALCAEHEISISFIDMFGHFVAKVTPPVYGNVLLRREQYRHADNPGKASEYARNMLIGKIANSRKILQRAIREKNMSSKSRAVLLDLEMQLNGLKNRKFISRDELMGIEGDCAVRYFSCFDEQILHNRGDFYFRGRNRRPPTDRVNAMLSLGYTLLTSETAAALETVGLDPYVGFLHCDRPGRPSLALDLMEELRACTVDRFVLSLINLQRIRADDFHIAENGAVALTKEARNKKFLPAWQKRKKQTITHPYLKEKMPAGLLPYIQALLLARAVRGGLDGYPPYFVR